MTIEIDDYIGAIEAADEFAVTLGWNLKMADTLGIADIAILVLILILTFCVGQDHESFEYFPLISSHSHYIQMQLNSSLKSSFSHDINQKY